MAMIKLYMPAPELRLFQLLVSLTKVACAGFIAAAMNVCYSLRSRLPKGPPAAAGKRLAKR